MKLITSPDLNVVLVEPQIPPNTGNIARLCAATAKCHLILLGELGFELSNRYLKRAGLDYWEYVSWEHILETDQFLNRLPNDKIHLLTTHSDRPYTQMHVQFGDYIFFGKETAGLPKPWLHQNPDRTFTIPMWESKVRSLNLASAVSVVVYDALRVLHKF
jgi:tRNA (cytidine/uridine-2'-O-)-methyltransferase